MYITEYQGILFLEGPYSNAEAIEPVSTTIKGIFESAQIRSLNDVKAKLAKIAEKMGANAIIEFQYGQKSASLWQSLFSRDDVHWYGSGFAVRLSDQDYQEFLKQRR